MTTSNQPGAIECRVGWRPAGGRFTTWWRGTLGRLAEEPDEDERWRRVNEWSEVMNLAVVRLPGEAPSDTAQQIAPAMFDEVQNETSELDAARTPGSPRDGCRCARQRRAAAAVTARASGLDTVDLRLELRERSTRRDYDRLRRWLDR